MSDLTRREFSESVSVVGAVAAASPALAAPALAQIAPHVVVVGGGAGGATVVRRLRENAPSVRVTLIEANSVYASSFMSEHFVGGYRSLNSLTHSYDGLSALDVEVIHDLVTGIDAATRTVTLKSGATLTYDKLVLSPGVALRYDTVEGYGPEVTDKIPHAWLNGAQNAHLRNLLLDMADGGIVVMSVPAGRVRGETAPYTRASMVAHYLKYHKPKSKLILLDANRDFDLRDAFQEGWALNYEGILEHRLSTTPDEFRVVRVDANTLDAETQNGERFKADVMSLLPEQQAGAIAEAAGCVDEGWCPVDPATFASSKVPDIHVLGDAADIGIMPKTAFAANSQGIVVANHLAAELDGKKKFPVRYRSTQWSLLATNNAIKRGASYVVGKGELVEASSFTSQVKEPEAVRARNFEESLAWYDALTKDMFAG